MTTFALVQRKNLFRQTGHSRSQNSEEDFKEPSQGKSYQTPRIKTERINGDGKEIFFISQIGLVFLKPRVQFSTTVYFHSASDLGSPWPAQDSRDEAERVRCGRLGDGVSGRAIVISDREFRNNSKALAISNHQQHGTAEQLTTKDIDLHKDENRSNHHTDKYEHSNLIARRGQDFDVTVIFNRPYDASKDTVTLQFAVGYRPQESKGTIIRVPVSLTREFVHGAWSAKIAQTNQERVRLQITSPPDAVVGRYHLYVETKTSVPGVEKETDFRYQHPEEIIMLFNPWCKDDTVCLDQETSREEYVLNDSGLIWVGTAKKNCGMPWNFGQFEDVSLNTCLWLLERGQLGTAARANPVRVTRCISAMANFNDKDGGVLYGRWDNDYPKDTTAPTAWSGSVAILEKFWQKKNVVKFAQCWVFSGLVTTLLRAIGIPTRSVTNFASAHDSDASMTVDFHFDQDGKPLKEMDDSVWNFHVWNESWFKRPDLPDGHDGWQAHDATPQETSFGVFRCGPASVKAIKQGEVYLPFDTSFVFAEVNGDRVFWEVAERGSMKVIRVDKKCIGKMISTKAEGSDDRDDITHQYKHPEGSVQERRAVEMAYKYSSRKDQAIYGLPTEDVKFSFELPDDVPIGKDVSVSLKMKNTNYKSRAVRGKITAMIGFYTGIPSKDLKEEDFEITLDPWEERSFVLDIPAALYLDKCKADGGLKIYVKATVKESEQRFASYDTIDFQKPRINMEITRGEALVGQDFEVKVSFVNPLPVRVSGGQWYIETSGANPKSKTIPNSAIVPEGKEVVTNFKLTPYRVGVCRVSVTFRADMLSGVYGMSGVRVRQ
ncbi:coagulation factor XIII A chain-like isoform X1 [Stylophora pistillata]|uniref:coagulation factor XIII A chain-like isoform X1 n=1 Tax=Stylophora pistillata TaxID=50429 RepID=UPI000C04F3A6|nr:coagulation factor XIII A chain-like isoform X1 [Stylophora pistillata]